MGGFLDFIPGTSFLHKLNPLTKLIVAIVLCGCCFVSGNIIYVIAVIGINLVLSASCGALKRSIKMIMALLKLSVLLFFIQILFIQDGIALVALPFNILITDKGLSFSFLFVLLMISSTMPLSLMLSVTQMSDLTNVMVEKLRIPYKYTFVLTTAVRFIPTFSSEMTGIIEAQTARGVQFDTKNIFKKIKLLLPMCVPLLLSSVKKIDNNAISAELRGFNLRCRRSGYKQYKFLLMDLIAILCCTVLLATAVVIKINLK